MGAGSRGGVGEDCQQRKCFFWGSWNVLELDGGNDCITS